MKHELKIIALSDCQLECSCSWRYTFTGSVTKTEAKKIYLQHIYRDFVFEWEKTHSISKAPSFSSWKINYYNK